MNLDKRNNNINTCILINLTILEELEFVVVFALPKEWITVSEATKCWKRINKDFNLLCTFTLK